MTPQIEALLHQFQELKSLNHIPHAILLDAYEESPHFAVAIELAKLLVCQKSPAPCSHCEHCKRIASLKSPDFLILFPLTSEIYRKKGEENLNDLIEEFKQNPFITLFSWIEILNAQNKTLNIQAERIRQIRNELYLAKYHLPVKIVLIWYAEFMHPAAANSLLKILEEPPANTYFILTTEQRAKLLPTVRSRCQVFRLPPESYTFMTQFLEKQQLPLSPQMKEHLLILANGSPAKLLRLLSQMETDSFLQFLTQWIQALLQDQISVIYQLNNQFTQFSTIEKVEILSLFAYYLLLSQTYHLTHTSQKLPIYVGRLRKALPPEAIPLLIGELDKAITYVHRNVITSYWFLYFYITFSKYRKQKIPS